MRQAVTLVKAVCFDSPQANDHDDFIEGVRLLLTLSANSEAAGPAFSVEVVVGMAALEERLKVGDVRSVFFFSCGMIEFAREIKGCYPVVRVVVLTALVPNDEIDDEIIIFDKCQDIAALASLA